MDPIIRKLSCARWADAVIYGGEARWVEVANDPSQDLAGQVAQILQQIDDMLSYLNSSKDRLLEIVIYLADLNDVATFNRLWDAWVDGSHPPIRACVQAGLQTPYLAELIIRSAV